MLLPLLDLAPELQSLFVLLLVDTATAGRLAQASSACKELLQHRLDELREERRGVEQARMEETKQRTGSALPFSGALRRPTVGHSTNASFYVLLMAPRVGAGFVHQTAAASMCSVSRRTWSASTLRYLR